jgi:hypothetical protein
VKAIDAFPLQWPDGWRRTDPGKRKHGAYKVDFVRARDELVREARLLGSRPEDVVISSSMALRRDGIPYAQQREPDDPGVAVYWAKRTWSREAEHVQQRVIACDAWRTVRENMRAIGLAIGSLRQLERTGASEILDRAFTGFVALPAAGGSARPWWADELGLDILAGLTGDVIKNAYRARAMVVHPDRGGTDAAMAKLNQARDEALRSVDR